ncbi:hypothetical protein D3C77_574050 [compost metagenome]
MVLVWVVKGGSGTGFVIVELLDQWNCHASLLNDKGGSCTRVSRPGIKEPGAHEGAPRTAAITRDNRHKKSAG